MCIYGHFTMIIAAVKPTTDFIIILIALEQEPFKQAHQNSPQPQMKDNLFTDLSLLCERV